MSSHVEELHHAAQMLAACITSYYEAEQEWEAHQEDKVSGTDDIAIAWRRRSSELFVTMTDARDSARQAHVDYKRVARAANQNRRF